MKWYSKKYDLTPLLGLWHETMCLDLGWQNVGAPRKSTIAGLPSWTWLAWDDFIRVPSNTGVPKHMSFLRVIDCSINWAGEPMTSALKSVDLRVQAPLKTYTLPQKPNEVRFRLNGWRNSLVILDELRSSSIPYRDTFQSEIVNLLILARFRAHGQDNKSIVTYLVVQKMPGNTAFPRYKRIGPEKWTW